MGKRSDFERKPRDYYDTPYKKEYHIPERDENKVKADKSLVGTYWEIDKYINRVGYLYEAGNLDWQDVKLEEDEILLETFKEALPWTQKDAETRDVTAKNILNNYKSKNLPLPTYQANGRLVKKLRVNGGDDARWRRMWFIDTESEYPYTNSLVIKITGTTRKLTGKWYAGSSGYDYWGEWEYEPSGLSPAIHHTLFVADVLIESNSGEWFCHNELVLVHPDDLIQEVSHLFN